MAETTKTAGVFVSYSKTKEKAKELAGASFERIQKEGLAPTPENFELWYVYYGDSHPEVVRAIDMLIANNYPITDEECREIHARFLSDMKEREHVRMTGDRVHATIKKVKTIMHGVQEATVEYNSALADVTQKLEKGATEKDIQAILQKVRSSTTAMVEHNQKLEEQLEKSSFVMEELQRNLELVRKEAMTDALTDLANRKAFDNEIQRIMRDSIEDGSAFSIVMFDIDHFKSFNDTYGHQIGDQVLRLVARTLIEGVKGKDIAARYGGEEFALILPSTNINAALTVANALRKAVANKEVVNRNSGEKLGRITLSGGAAQYMAGESLDSLVDRADAALYTAKHNGRNQIAAAPHALKQAAS